MSTIFVMGFNSIFNHQDQNKTFFFLQVLKSLFVLFILCVNNKVAGDDCQISECSMGVPAIPTSKEIHAEPRREMSSEKIIEGSKVFHYKVIKTETPLKSILLVSTEETYSITVSGYLHLSNERGSFASMWLIPHAINLGKREGWDVWSVDFSYVTVSEGERIEIYAELHTDAGQIHRIQIVE